MEKVSVTVLSLVHLHRFATCKDLAQIAFIFSEAHSGSVLACQQEKNRTSPLWKIKMNFFLSYDNGASTRKALGNRSTSFSASPSTQWVQPCLKGVSRRERKKRKVVTICYMSHSLSGEIGHVDKMPWRCFMYSFIHLLFQKKTAWEGAFLSV